MKITLNIAAGSMVRLKAKPSLLGAVVGHLPGEPEDRYQVFHDGAVTVYYASQIEPALSVPTQIKVTPQVLHAALTALQLRHPSTTNLYSLYASRINFVPYQFRPVLKLINADRPRLLIADEVGVGKTIEAGLILKELQARREIRSVLVICPKPLVAERKWQEELKRFDEQFDHLDGASLRYCLEETHLDGVWPHKYSRAILPYSLLDEVLLMGEQQGRKKRRGLLDLDPPPVFDLIIVDEAHHLRNTDTWAHRAVRYFCDNAEAVVFLTATPIQLGDNDLYTLLHMLRPDVIPSCQAFEQMAEPNPYINAAIESARRTQTGWQNSVRTAIAQAIATTWGRNVLTANNQPQAILELLDTESSNPENRLKLIGKLEGMYTFSHLINRTRRRDIGNFTTRKPETVAVDYTPEQKALHYDLIKLISRMLARRHGDKNLKFMLTTVRRQVASCVFGLAPLLNDTLNRHLSLVQLSEMSDEDNPDDLGEVFAEFRSDVEALVQRANGITGADPKFDAFLKVIRDKQGLSNNKLLVFSTFRHTLAYLERKLSTASIRMGLIHGDVQDEERRDLRSRFSLPKDKPQAIDILLSSEVGCEGLDFQFCDGLVNYDLPWNPMRVEQRIGRIDRYGQKSETVAIYNFITPCTVDAEIYERCLLRIGLFRQALGGSEEILGKLTRKIHEIAENLELSDEERSSRLQQLADNEIRIIQEQTKLEEEQSKLFGLAVPKSDNEMVKQASSFWLSPVMLANLVARYLERRGVNNLPASLGRKPVVTLQLGQDIREKLLKDLQALNITGKIAHAWELWLKENDPYLALTFEPVTADDRRDLVFITPTHPLVRQASKYFDTDKQHAGVKNAHLICNLSSKIDSLQPGRYPYAIYRWHTIGLREDFTFQPVCTHPELAACMFELLEIATHSDVPMQDITTDEEHSLEQAHYRQWINARSVHIEHVTQTARSRLASLDTTHAARIALLGEQMDIATDVRIRRMKESQIETAQRDYERRAGELKHAAEQADVMAEVVAFGVLAVRGNK